MKVNHWMLAGFLFMAGQIACAPTYKQIVISMVDLDCASCGDDLVHQLNRGEATKDAQFNLNSAEITVSYDPQHTTPENLVSTLQSDAYKLTLGPGKGSYMPMAKFAKNADVKTISKNGEAVWLEKHWVRGKITLFDFYADWCGPCRKINDFLKVQAETRNDLAIRKINIVDWDSPAAQKHLAHVAGLPFVVVYGPLGTKLGHVEGLKFEQIEKLIAPRTK